MAGAAHPARRLRGSRSLPSSFYDRETEVVARELLGAILECETPAGLAGGRIVETEAYLGEHDPACHAAVGKTDRTRWLYGTPGTAYVYFIYGVHWCFNAVTRARGLPSAVLVRALEPVTGLELMRARRPRARTIEDIASGPGKLCSALGIDGTHNGHPLHRPPLRIRAGDAIPDSAVVVGARIGITRAADWPLRWYVAGSRFVSRTPRRGRLSR
jgi:DNA-3-methyladenine glycosylase